MIFNFILKDPEAGDDLVTVHNPREAVVFLTELLRDFSQMEVSTEVTITLEITPPKVEPPRIITLN